MATALPLFLAVAATMSSCAFIYASSRVLSRNTLLRAPLTPIVLASLDPHPESVPVNLLVRAPGTPLACAPELDVFELVRTVAAARLLMPRARVRLSAGRTSLSREAQALCFLAGANSIFFGDRLLTTPNPGVDADLALLADLGLHAT